MNRFYLILGVLCAFVVQGAQRPNIIFFLVDDYDKPETSPYGGKVLTPNLERLAAEGMLFNNAYVTSTVCTPSRYTMLTGRYAGSSTSKQFLSLFPKGRQSMPGFNVSLEHDNMTVGNVLAAMATPPVLWASITWAPSTMRTFTKRQGLRHPQERRIHRPTQPTQISERKDPPQADPGTRLHLGEEHLLGEPQGTLQGTQPGVDHRRRDRVHRRAQGSALLPACLLHPAAWPEP